jgi:ribosome-associated protein
VISVEGSDTGEWVLVDCADAVVHILQPTYRSYYNLEEIWGEKPVRLKSAPQTTIGRKVPARKTPARTAKPRSKPARVRARSPGCFVIKACRR